MAKNPELQDHYLRLQRRLARNPELQDHFLRLERRLARNPELQDHFLRLQRRMARNPELQDHFLRLQLHSLHQSQNFFFKLPDRFVRVYRIAAFEADESGEAGVLDCPKNINIV